MRAFVDSSPDITDPRCVAHPPTQSNLPTRSVNLYATSAPIRGPTYDTTAPTASSSSSTSAFWDGPSAGGSAYQSTANQYVPPPSMVAPQQQHQQASGGPVPGTNDGRRVVLQNGAIVGLEEARAFMDYYCGFLSSDCTHQVYRTLTRTRKPHPQAPASRSVAPN